MKTKLLVVIAIFNLFVDNAGLSHEKLLRSIELIGTRVAPLVNG